MAIEMKVPPVGESITEVTIAAWNKKDGDVVKMDEVLCELESDKATFELPAEAEGVLKIVAKEGETLAIGAVICTIETDGKSTSQPSAENNKSVDTAPVAPVAAPAPSPAPAESPKPTAESQKVIEIKIPAVGESITEVTVSVWSKKEGDSVKMDEVLCELESDKATFELPAEAAGTLHIVAQEGTVLAIGAVVATITVGVGASNSAPQPVATPAPSTAQSTATPLQSDSYASGHASPAAAKILSEKGIETGTVQGTGVDGRITKEDAQSANKPVAVPMPAPVAPSTEAKPAPSSPQVAQTSGRSQRREKMTSLRKTVARRLVAVKNETAMLTTFNEVDMKPIMDLRGKYKDKF